jgi:putative phosphoesterase
MRLGVLSDTHGHVQNTLAAVRLLKSLEVEELLHCGDLCSTEIPRLLAAWPTHYVFGNCDIDLDGMRLAIAAAGGLCHDWFGELTLGGRRVALLHGHEGKKLLAAVQGGQYDLVCYGHTHAAEFHHEDRTLVLNPGALYRASRHTIAVVDLETMESLIVPV